MIFIVFLFLFLLSVSCSQNVSKENFSALSKKSVYFFNAKKGLYAKKVNPEINLTKICEINGTFPLGDIVFLEKEKIVFPYVKVRRLTEKEKKEYLERRKEYLKKSPEELAKEVVKKEKDETDISYKLRKELSKWFFKIAKSKPDLFFKPPREVASEIGLAVVNISKNSCSVIKKIPLIRQEIPVDTQCSVQSGTNLIKKPFKVCRNWLGIDSFVVVDDKNIYFTLDNFRIKNLPSFVVDKRSFAVKGLIDNVKIESNLGKNLLKAFIISENKVAIGKVNNLDFIIIDKFKFPQGKAILYKDRYLLNQKFPVVYDLKTKTKKSISKESFQELSGKLYALRVGELKIINQNLSKVINRLWLCNTFKGDISNFCFLYGSIDDNYLLFLHDKGVPAREPKTGRIYGAGLTYRAQLWAFDTKKKVKFPILKDDLEYHLKFIRFVRYNPESKLLALIDMPDKVLVFKVNY